MRAGCEICGSTYWPSQVGCAECCAPLCLDCQDLHLCQEWWDMMSDLCGLALRPALEAAWAARPGVELEIVLEWHPESPLTSLLLGGGYWAAMLRGVMYFRGVGRTPWAALRSCLAMYVEVSR